MKRISHVLPLALNWLALRRLLLAHHFSRLCFISLALLLSANLSNANSDRSNHLTSAVERESLPKTLVSPGNNSPQAATKRTLECSSQKSENFKKGGSLPAEVRSAARNASSLEFHCLSSPAVVHHAWLRKGSNILVDVRNSKLFSKARIGGSINLPAYTIKSKNFLKNQSIVLLNEGYEHLRLDELCHRLKTKGFQKVAVLRGGLSAWKEKGYPVVGDKLAIRKLNHISPSDFIMSTNERHWTYVYVGGMTDTIKKRLPKDYSFVEYLGDDKKFIKSLRSKQRSGGSSQLYGYAVISANGQDYESVEKLLHQSNINNAYYIAGGMGALNEYMELHFRLLSRSGRGFKEKHGCS